MAAAFGAFKSHARPSLTGLWLHMAAGLLILLGGLYLSYAVFLALAEQLGPPWAGALTGAALMLVAGLLMLWALLLNRKPPPREHPDLMDIVLRAGDLIGHKIEAPGAGTAIAALLAGVVAGASPKTRGFMLNLADQLLKDFKGEPK